MCDAFRRGRESWESFIGEVSESWFWRLHRSFQSIQEEKRNFGHWAKHTQGPQDNAGLGEAECWGQRVLGDNLYSFVWLVSGSVVSGSLRPHGLDSPSGSFIHGILQARILEWVAISFSRGSFQPRDRTQVSHIADRFFTNWAPREAQRLLYKLCLNIEWVC